MDERLDALCPRVAIRERGGSGGNRAGVGIGHLEVHLLPDCIERIGALVIHDDGSVGQIFCFGSSTIGGPAEELVAGTGEAKFRIALQGDGFVVQVILRRDSSGAAVGIVGQGRECGLVAPDGIEGDVGDMDGNLVAGLIDDTAVFLGTPTQEHLALGGDQVGSGHDIGIGTVGIGLGVRGRGAGAAVGIISDFEGLVAGVVGIEGNIVVDQGVEVEGGVDVVGSISTPHSPASPGVAVGHFRFGLLGREVSLVDLGAVRNGNGLGFAAGHGQIGSALKLRRGPLGVDGDALGRHFAGEHILLALAQLIVVPAHEHILRGDARRAGGGVGHIGDVRLVLFGDRVLYRAIIDELNLVAVAVVVELCAVVIALVLCTVGCIFAKAGNVIEVLIGNIGLFHHYRVGMVQLIRSPVNNSTLLALQNLNIVTGAEGIAAFVAGNIEVAAIQRHYINTRLIGAASVGAFRPVGTAVAAAGPLIADVSTVLGSDGKECAAAGGLIAGVDVGVLFLGTGQIPLSLAFPGISIAFTVSSIIPRRMGMLFLAADGGFGTAAAVGGPEVDGVLIPLVVHIDDGASVTGDGLLLNLPGSKSLVRLGGCRCGLTGGAGLGFGFLEGEIIIVHILLPVNHGVPGIGVALPMGGEGDVLSQLAAESKRSIPIVPALEGIAHPGGIGGSHGNTIGVYKRGGSIAAALGIKGNPGAGLYLGVEGDVGAVNGYGSHLVGTVGISVPAGDGLVSIHGECNIRRDYFVGDALPGGADHASRIQEEHIVHRGEGRGVGIGGAADAGLCAGDERVTAAEPAGELIALLLGRGGGVDSLARLDLLGAHRPAVNHKLVGVDVGPGLHDRQVIDLGPGFRLHIVDGEGQFLGGLRGEGQGSGAVIIGEDILRVGVHGNSAVHSGQGHFGAGLAGDGDGVDLGVGERHLRTLRGFLLQVTADGVGHIGRLLLGGSLLGGCGGHGDLPDLFLVADRIGDGGRALGHTENLGNVLFAGVSFFRPDSGGGDIVTCPLAAVFSGSGQLDAAVHIHGGILGRLFLGLGVLSGGILSLGVLSRGILSRGILSLGLLNCGFLSRRFLGFGFLSCGILSLGILSCGILSGGFLSRRFLGFGFLSSRLHDGRLRLGDYRGGGAEREGVGGA